MRRPPRPPVRALLPLRPLALALLLALTGATAAHAAAAPITAPASSAASAPCEDPRDQARSVLARGLAVYAPHLTPAQRAELADHLVRNVLVPAVRDESATALLAKVRPLAALTRGDVQQGTAVFRELLHVAAADQSASAPVRLATSGLERDLVNALGLMAVFADALADLSAPARS
ncbi:hypothetical protein H9Y04_02470 [Streptomyces sp. TRM66268-LWL]|uniref:Secreted protein n=1 Tax=Streptomyces polyasparticus TaxID=2767826 RepID=A0ABR7S7I6_9ACTN|nr:hypothetical protein [Streptomyces polyasparticus]MBC9711436.1 hypothetical protein [Streptomyces polyasparticus]